MGGCVKIFYRKHFSFLFWGHILTAWDRMTFTGLKTKVRTIDFTNKCCRVFLKFAVAKLGSLFLRQFGRHFIISVGDGIVFSGNNGRHTV